MTAGLRDHVRQGALAKVRRLDAARGMIRDLTHDERQVIYVDLEALLEGNAGVGAPARASAKVDPSRRHCKVCGDAGHNSRTCKKPRKAPTVKTKAAKPKWTDVIEAIIRENPRGLRTCEIAAKTTQTTPNAFGTLKQLLHAGRVERHGQRFKTLWTLPGRAPEPRVETVAAAIVHVLDEAEGPVDARVLHDAVVRIIHRALGKTPKDTSVRTELARLVSKRVVARRGANEHGPMFILASERGGLEGAPALN